jgi:myosin light chain 6
VSITGSKRVSFEEFLPIYLSSQGKKEEGSMEDFIEGLKVFDKEGNGFINSAELRHVLTSLGESFWDLASCEIRES